MSVMTQISVDAASRERLGVAAITRAAFKGNGLSALTAKLLATLSENPHDAGALMDMSVVEQIRGNLQGGLDLQTSALQWCQSYKTQSMHPAHLRLLALAAPIHMGGNTPVEFLIADAPISLTTLYVTPGTPLPDPVPEHDLAFVVAPGDSDFTRPYLDEIAKHASVWSKPVLNAPCNIRNLERDQLAEILGDVRTLCLPRICRMSRDRVAALGGGVCRIEEIWPDAAWPLVVRPVGAHAGRNLELIARPELFSDYLATCDDNEFFLSDYIDYRSGDGVFRKYRIVFVDGKAYPCHMAIADQWKVWYMNADMVTNAEKRAEEEAFMSDFDHGFAARHHAALSEIVKHVDLDYFGIDCAEHPDGRLVVFEADNALIVHDMDAPDIFPYKPAEMRRIFEAFADLVKDRAGAVSQAS